MAYRPLFTKPEYNLHASSSTRSNHQEHDTPPTEVCGFTGVIFLPFFYWRFQRYILPRRGAVDFTATGAVRSDYWHRGMASRVVSRNPSQFPAIRFFPPDGVESGVAMTECEYSVGVAIPNQSVFQQLPPVFQQVKIGILIITVRISPWMPTFTYRWHFSGLDTSICNGGTRLSLSLLTVLLFVLPRWPAK